MLSVTSPHSWALSWVPASQETFPVSGLGGMGQGEPFVLAVPKQLRAGSGPQESEPCTRGTSTALPAHQERQIAVSSHVPARGMSPGGEARAGESLDGAEQWLLLSPPSQCQLPALPSCWLS